jgi:hypothetical protein
MTHTIVGKLRHPVFSRRDLLQAGAVGLMGLSLTDLKAAPAQGPPKSVIYLFLSGGLSQHESFDPKPDAPDNVRGEFAPVRTRTPGVLISEHLPRLAARSSQWALVRSLSHGSNDHSLGHHIMLTGRSEAPPRFNPSQPQPDDFPAIAAVAGGVLGQRVGLPPAAVLPFTLVHDTGRVIPGQFAGQMGVRHEPWLVQAAHQCPRYGACPNCFDHQRRPGRHALTPIFQTPNLRLPEGLSEARFTRRRGLLEVIERQQRGLDRVAATSSLDQSRATAWSLLTSGRVRAAFDLDRERPEVLDAYGRNLFGWSCLLARRLVEVGVRLVQVNLGRNETWDTHGNMFPHLKDNLLPPMDRCVSALLDDLEARGLLDTTLIVMAGEFGRTPRISTLPQFYALPGRDHWGAVQTVFLAGGGVRGGTVIGASDHLGAFPRDARQTPENLAATIYDTLGIDRHAAWQDATGRPFHVYHAEPIRGLTA